LSFMSSKLRRVRTIADFQFGRGAGSALFPDDSEFLMSRTNRIRQVSSNGTRIATVRAKDGFLTLSKEGALRMHDFLELPAYRVTVHADAVPFVLKGKTLFAKHVVDVDPSIRAMDEVLLVNLENDLLITGQALLCAAEMKDFNYGAAVAVRKSKD
jgi:uncharacterized protein with predicted RNA binding PUA domain